MAELYKPDNGEVERQPFEIRGHHLPVFISFIQSYTQRDDEEWKRSVIYAAVGAQVYILRKARAEGRELDYVKDVIGTTQDDEQMYRSKYTQVLENFLSLPDDYPTRILFNEKDVLCDICYIGNHCSKKKAINMDRNITQYILGKQFESGDTIELGRLKEILLGINFDIFKMNFK